ncbi:MAG TPA: UDP-N-acetylglucosamine 1-carboxyvinyltransferase [Candidatus Levybacteria bacterium]|nr:UDP-N-acetylglucosamine 1-carboxyvinyltransferase [Candidatus Levybacteria bacterium]
MKKYIINGGRKLSGEVTISGAKNIALKAIVAACLTQEKVVIRNIPKISDVYNMLDLVKSIGGVVTIDDHTVTIEAGKLSTFTIPLEAGAKTRTSTLFLAPLLARAKEAIIPNPGGCRIGARPIDRIVDGLEKMNVEILYNSEDGYFHAKTQGLKGTIYRFSKNSHTGTETMILTAVLADGKTVIQNAALEPEVDSLIELLNMMGARVTRKEGKEIEIIGVSELHGAEYTLPQDRNEVATFAIASILTGGDIFIQDVDLKSLDAFINECKKAGVSVEVRGSDIRFYRTGDILPTNITTNPHPGFMTDWQGVWALLMTQANGTSYIHETVYENRFGYMKELNKMGAEISFVNPDMGNYDEIYNFNYDPKQEYHQKIEIKGPTALHNAVLSMSDLRAGATLVLASLIASGTSVIYGIEQVQRGYEKFDERLKMLGADIECKEEK